MAIPIQIPATENQLPDAVLIVNTAFSFKSAENIGFWI
jgi:hypothetical protein